MTQTFAYYVPISLRFLPRFLAFPERRWCTDFEVAPRGGADLKV
jgi:hypothetical protein